MKKQFFVAAMALTLGVGLTACSSDNLDVKGGTEQAQKGSTYMSVSFELPKASATRAADDKQDQTDPEFNNVGKWEGQDKIEKVFVYVFDNATNTLEKKQVYTAAQLNFSQDNTGSNEAVVKANSAFRVNPGTKLVYVVVNPNDKVDALLPHVEGATTLTDFENAYKSANLGLDAPLRATTYTTDDKSRAGQVAKVEGSSTSALDVIMMTGPVSAPTVIADNISAQQAVAGQNTAKLKVQRAAARVLVTTKDETYKIKGQDPANMTSEIDLVEVSNFTYVVAQGEANLYFQQKQLDATKPTEAPTITANGSAFLTPAFSQVNAALAINPPTVVDQYWDKDAMDQYVAIGKFYDYSSLWKSTSTTANIKGVTVPKRDAFETTKANELGKVTADLRDGLDGEFVLPTLHKYNTDRAKSGYRKGNTAYILVRAQMKPLKYVKTGGTVAINSGADEKPVTQDWYLGANGKFYESSADVQNPANGGVAGQTAQLYKAGKVLYFLWLNPDVLENNKWVNSPVLRNNIYHVQIGGVGKIGANWNPLVPFDPTDPNYPTGPFDPSNPKYPNNPNNPDPRPNNPLEPVTPPVDPTDPLSFKETWMAVQVNIIPWQVHSYPVVLGI